MSYASVRAGPAYQLCHMNKPVMATQPRDDRVES